MILPSSFIDTTKYFGLSISQSSLKAVSITDNNEIDSYAQFPLDQNVLNGQVNNSELFINGLNTIKSQGKFESTYVAVVLPETFAFSREFSTPKVSMSELNEAIEWQIDDIFPFSTEDIYYDWKLMSSNDEEINALVVSMQKKLIDSIRNTLAKAQLYPISFEPAVSALSKISTIEDKDYIILIDIDQKGISASLIQKGISLLTTTNPNYSNQHTVSTIQSSINSLLSYYLEKNKKPLEKYQLLLTGDLAEKNLLSTINNQLKINAELLEITNITPPFHKAYAAASSNIFPPESEKSINLLPQDLNTWYQDHYHQSIYKKTSRYLMGTLAVSTIVAVSSIGYLSILNNNTPTANIPAPNSNTEEINTQAILKNANQINVLFPQKVGPQEELNIALSLIPSTIKVESISYDTAKNKFQIFGISQDRQNLIDFKNLLEESEVFYKINLPLGALTSKENSTFTIDFTVKPKSL